MNHFEAQFFAAALTAGSVITGLCGLFLVFRIQREADYFRRSKEQHFTSSMLLIGLATIVSLTFGVWMPLFALVGERFFLNSSTAIVGGLVAASVLVLGYILDELVHYEIFCPGRSAHGSSWVKIDPDFRRELWVWLPIIILSLFLGLLSSLLACRASSTTQVTSDRKSHPSADLAPERKGSRPARAGTDKRPSARAVGPSKIAPG